MNIANTGKAFNHLRNLLDTSKPTVSPIAFHEKKPILTNSGNRFFQRATPEECGIESSLVAEFIKSLAENKRVAMHGIMLLRNGRVFFEAEVGNQEADLPKATFSECKSIVSLAIGALVTQGKLKINELITDIFSEKLTPVARIRLKGLTVKHLLTMTACVTFNESEAMISEDWLKEFLSSDTEGEFGHTFRYNSLNTYMLVAVIKERTGMGLCEYLDSTLFGALEIKNYYWEKCPMGLEKGGWGLYITREDIAKLGTLVMQKGVWNGKRLIAERYIDDATKTQAETPEEYGGFNYGFQIWAGRKTDSFLFNGMLGQNLLGYRRNGIIIAINCGNTDTFQQGDFFCIADRFFNRDFMNTIPNNEEEYSSLCNIKETLKQKPKKRSILKISDIKRDTEGDIDALDGRMFRTDGPHAASTGLAPLFLQTIQGNYTSGLKQIGFRRAEGGLEIAFIECAGTHRITIGFEKAVRNTAVFNGEPYIVSAYGEFTDNEDGIPVLKAEFDFLETPYRRSCKFCFDSDIITAVFDESPGYEMTASSAALMFLLGTNRQRLEGMFSKIDSDYFAVKFGKAFAPKLIMVEESPK